MEEGKAGESRQLAQPRPGTCSLRRDAAARSSPRACSSPMGRGCCCPQTLSAGERANSQESPGWLRQRAATEGRGGWGADGPWVQSSPSVSRHGVVCYLLLQPSLLLPGKTLWQENRQTDTPRKTADQAPVAPQNPPQPWPRPSCSSRFLQSPPHPPLQPKTLERHHLLCPWGSSPA